MTIARWFACAWLCLAISAAETGSIKGRVLGSNGKPVKAAVVRFLRDGTVISGQTETMTAVLVTKHFAGGAAISFPVSQAGVYSVTPNKKGQYEHSGLPFGTYTMAVEVNGEIAEKVSGVIVSRKESITQDFEVSILPLSIFGQLFRKLFGSARSVDVPGDAIAKPPPSVKNPEEPRPTPAVAQPVTRGARLLSRLILRPQTQTIRLFARSEWRIMKTGSWWMSGVR